MKPFSLKQNRHLKGRSGNGKVAVISRKIWRRVGDEKGYMMVGVKGGTESIRWTDLISLKPPYAIPTEHHNSKGVQGDTFTKLDFTFNADHGGCHLESQEDRVLS